MKCDLCSKKVVLPSWFQGLALCNDCYETQIMRQAIRNMEARKIREARKTKMEVNKNNGRKTKENSST